MQGLEPLIVPGGLSVKSLEPQIVAEGSVQGLEPPDINRGGGSVQGLKSPVAARGFYAGPGSPRYQPGVGGAGSVQVPEPPIAARGVHIEAGAP